MAEQRPVPDDEVAIAQQAADWLVRIGSDDPDESARAAAGFADWKAKDPRHREAALRMQAFLRRVETLRDAGPAAGRAMCVVLDDGRDGRRMTARHAGSALALAIALAVPAWLVLDGNAVEPLFPKAADLRSAQGEWRRTLLEDGSHLTLGGAGAVRLRFDGTERVVELLRGSMLVEVAHDSRRPFVVETSLGRVRALGTRFTVTLDSDGMRVEMLESRVAVQAAGPQGQRNGEALELRAGQRATVKAAGVGPVERLEPESVEAGWQRHQLIADDRPLTEVLDQLSRHHRGMLRYDRDALAGIRVTAVLPLDDTARSLRLLQLSFPQLKVRSLTSRWSWVGWAPPP